MKRPPRSRLAAALLLVALASCGEAPRDAEPEGAAGAGTDQTAPPGPTVDDTTAVTAPSSPSAWAYTCPEGPRLVVHYREDEARVELPDRELVLPRDPSATGARYTSDEGLFHQRGGEAVLEVGARRYAGCRGEQAGSPEDAARLLGFDFRGLGQEPGWLVDIDADRQIRWIGDYGSVRFATGAPETEERDDGTVTWTATSAEHRITVRARPEACRDVMSGRPFSHTVEVTADGRTYSGCGLRLQDG